VHSTVQKALSLLEHFSESDPEIGLSEFKHRTGYDKGTVHRYLTDLRECGFLQQNSLTKSYSLGPAVIRLANLRERTNPLRSVAEGIVRDVAQEFGELVHASLPQANGMTVLFSYDGGRSGTRVGLDDSEILPFHGTSSGVVILAFGSPDIQQRILQNTKEQFTSATLTTTAELKSQIEIVQNCGYASLMNGYENDVSSVAVPFFDQAPTACGTLSIATPTPRMTDANRQKFLARLFEAAANMTDQIGGTVPKEYKTKISAS